MAALMTPKQFGYLFDLCRDAPISEGEAILHAVKVIRGVGDSSKTVEFRNSFTIDPLINAMSKDTWLTAKEIAAKMPEGTKSTSIRPKIDKMVREDRAEYRQRQSLRVTEVKLEYRLK